MEKKRNKKFIIYTVVSILIISIGVTLAYWITQILGEGNLLTFNIGNVKVTFTDSESIIVNDIVPGWTTSKTFSLTNESTRSYKYNIIIKDLVNTMVSENGLQYKITSSNGYNMIDYKAVPKSSEMTKEILAYNVEIPANTTQEYTIEFRYYDDPNENQSGDMGKAFTGSVFIEEGTEDPIKLSLQLISKYETVLTRTNFDDIVGTSEATEKTIYKTTEEWKTEDGSTVYYFAGNVSDNWVKFGKDSSDEDLYWRIIRTNEDGSVRLLYAGTSPDTTSGYISTTNPEYNKTKNNTMYVGYKYGTKGSLDNNRTNGNDSTVKVEIDKWYESGLLVKADTNEKVYDDYISKTAIYCNDRSTVDYQASGSMYYGVYNRLIHNNQNGRKATYRCGYNPVDTYKVSESGDTWGSTAIGMHTNASVADKFSVDASSGGNGDLTYPVALMTADEVAYAGGRRGIENPYAYYYLNSTNESATGNKDWWTMSPFSFNGVSAHVSSVCGISNGPGSLFSFIANNISVVTRPVVSIKSCATISGGNGKSNSPYEISIDEICSNSVN